MLERGRIWSEVAMISLNGVHRVTYIEGRRHVTARLF